MSDYAKALVKAVYSQNSDYNDPDTDTNYDEYEITPDELMSLRVDAETGGTVAMAANALATISLMIIINTHASNVVTAAFTNANGADSITIAGKNGMLVTTDVVATAALTLTSAGSVSSCRVLIFGS